MEKLYETLQCPICLERLTPPVKLCENEHAVCEFSCGKKLKECPVCKADFYCTTNKFINQFLEALPVACSNAIYGCSLMLPPSEIMQHQKICNNKLIKCFLCSTNNIIYSELANHFSSNKCGFSSFLPFNFGIYLYCDIKSFTGEVQKKNFVIVEKNSNAFFCPKYYVDAIHKALYLCVQYVGKREDANRYLYEIKFLQGYGLWFSRGNFCTPYFDSYEELKKHPNVLSFDMNNIFLNNNPPLLLRFQFKIIPL